MVECSVGEASYGSICFVQKLVNVRFCWIEKSSPFQEQSQNVQHFFRKKGKCRRKLGNIIRNVVNSVQQLQQGKSVSTCPQLVLPCTLEGIHDVDLPILGPRHILEISHCPPGRPSSGASINLRSHLKLAIGEFLAGPSCWKVRRSEENPGARVRLAA